MNRYLASLLVPAAAGLLALTVACGGGGKPGTAGFAEAQAGDFASDTTATSPQDLAKQIETVVKESQQATEGAVTRTGPVAAAPKATTAKPSKSSAGGCEVKVTGDVSLTFKSAAGSGSAGSEYWFGKDELRGAFTEIAKVLDPKSASEVEKAAKQASDDPWMLLILNCDGAEGGISLFPGVRSGYGDIPFGPKSYTIASGGLFGGGAKAGEFTALVTLGDDLYGLDEPGELKVTKFDKSGVAGTFSLKAGERFTFGASPKKVTLQGTFDFPCDGGSVCKK